MKVSALINKEEKCWNRDILAELFGEELSDEICLLPFSKMGHNDKLVWEASTDGKYSASSVYLLELRRIRREKGESLSGLVNSGVWKKIWALNIPSGVKSFMWKAVREALPTRKNLCIGGKCFQELFVLFVKG